MKKISTISVVLVLITYSALILTGCGRNRTNSHEDAEVLHISETIRLSISGDVMGEHIARQAIIPLQRRLAQEGVALYLDFSVFSPIDTESYFSQLLSRYEAGTGPDLFLVPNNFSLIPFMDNGFLGDFYSLIDQSSTINRDDFFVSILESLELDGQLHYMPMKFFFEYIGINEKLPSQFIDRFALLENASISDIIVIYLDLIDEYPAFADYVLIHGMDASLALASEISNLVDIADRSADFASIGVLSNAVRTVFADNDRFDTPLIRLFPTYDEMEMLQSRYIFTLSTHTRGLDALLDFEQLFFVHHIPRANERGELILSTTRNMAVSHTADPIVLDFIKYFIQEMARNPVTIDIMGVPILRQFSFESVDTGIRNHFSDIERATIGGVEQTDLILNRMTQYIDQQSTIPTINTLFSAELYMATFYDAFADDMATQEGVRLLEQSFNTWLNPEFVIEPLPTPVNVDIDDPNIRTLTILAHDMHTSIIRQAANELNSTWTSEGREYRFNIVINSYTWEETQSAHARLQTELMAGQGPDIFIWNQQPMHAFARSGLMANIYDLIDECPQTNRDDFFTQPLAALEMSGGLYMFPLSFGFQYVAINAHLPQSALDRFAEFSTISIYELFAFYHEVMADYGDDFGHLDIMCHSKVQLLRSALTSGFIDFDARRSNLIDDRFISLLERWASVDPWPDSFSFTTFNPITTPSDLRGIANNYMFVFDSAGLNPGQAFFDLNQTYFANHIPLTNEQGYLIINKEFLVNPSTWATVSIPTAGNSTLAWEFTRYLVSAYSRPTNVHSGFGGHTSLTSPIQRSLFDGHIRRALEQFASPWGDIFSPLWLVASQDPVEIERQIDNAVNRITAYNGMSIATMDSMIPRELIDEPLSQLARGIITSREAAQRLHNALSLWLME